MCWLSPGQYTFLLVPCLARILLTSHVKYHRFTQFWLYIWEIIKESTYHIYLVAVKCVPGETVSGYCVSYTFGNWMCTCSEVASNLVFGWQWYQMWPSYRTLASNTTHGLQPFTQPSLLSNQQQRQSELLTNYLQEAALWQKGKAPKQQCQKQERKSRMVQNKVEAENWR